jgi:hypothetical protein
VWRCIGQPYACPMQVPYSRRVAGCMASKAPKMLWLVGLYASCGGGRSSSGATCPSSPHGLACSEGQLFDSRHVVVVPPKANRCPSLDSRSTWENAGWPFPPAETRWLQSSKH